MTFAGLFITNNHNLLHLLVEVIQMQLQSRAIHMTAYLLMGGFTCFTCIWSIYVLIGIQFFSYSLVAPNVSHDMSLPPSLLIPFNSVSAASSPPQRLSSLSMRSLQPTVALLLIAGNFFPRDFFCFVKIQLVAAFPLQTWGAFYSPHESQFLLNSLPNPNQGTNKVSRISWIEDIYNPPQ